MALIAVDAVVYVALNALVVPIRTGFLMAVGALKDRVVVGVDVARRADPVRVSMRDRELRVLGVVERSVQPIGGAVAVLAGGGEELWLRRVPRVGRVVVVRLMAGDAQRAVQRVVVIDMAVGAQPRRHQVQARKGESRSGVVELAVGPGDGVVAVFAGRGEIRRNVVHRRRRAVVVLLMASDAQRAGQVVIVVDMAVAANAGRHQVRVGQRESGRRVVKLSVRPHDRVVATFTRRREVGLDMVHRRDRVGVVLLMASDAQGAGQVVVVVDMAVGADARRHQVRIGQRETRGGMVERRVQPGGRVMAGLAGLREVRGDVVGVGGALLVLQMARHARRGGQVVVVVDVAVGADSRGHKVQPGEREPRGGVVERRVQPGGRVVAGLTGLGEIRGDVVGVGGALIVLQVAGHAGRGGQVVVIVNVAVGADAGGHEMQPGQRESRSRVVKGRIEPRSRVVAGLAGLREIRGDVVGVTGALIVLQMT